MPLVASMKSVPPNLGVHARCLHALHICSPQTLLGWMSRTHFFPARSQLPKIFTSAKANLWHLSSVSADFFPAGQVPFGELGLLGHPTTVGAGLSSKDCEAVRVKPLQLSTLSTLSLPRSLMFQADALVLMFVCVHVQWGGGMTSGQYLVYAASCPSANWFVLHLNPRLAIALFTFALCSLVGSCFGRRLSFLGWVS